MVDCPEETFIRVYRECEAEYSKLPNPHPVANITHQWWTLMAEKLGRELGVVPEMFGGYVSGDRHNRHLTRLRNLRII